MCYVNWVLCTRSRVTTALLYRTSKKEFTLMPSHPKKYIKNNKNNKNIKNIKPSQKIYLRRLIRKNILRKRGPLLPSV
jgi:hypothetical protein